MDMGQIFMGSSNCYQVRNSQSSFITEFHGKPVNAVKSSRNVEQESSGCVPTQPVRLCGSGAAG